MLTMTMIRSPEIVELDILPLEVDFINENASVANPLPTPRVASIYKSQFTVVMLMECWIEAVHCYVSCNTLHQLHTRNVFY